MKNNTRVLLPGGSRDQQTRNPAVAILYSTVDRMWLCGSAGKERPELARAHSPSSGVMGTYKAPDEIFQDVNRYGKKRRSKESCGWNREDRRIFTGSLSSPHPGGRVQMRGDHGQGYRDGYLFHQI